MDPVTKALLTSWEWRIELIVLLLFLGILYGAGWRTLRRKGSKLAVGWRLAAYWAGLVLVGIALMSPIDTLSSQFFFMHMIQHLLLIMIAPPLLMVANPFPVVLWGLPDRARRSTGRGLSRLLHRNSRFRHALYKLTGPGLIWMITIGLLIVWHDPNLYNAALRYEWLHDLEHLSFFLPAVAYWWLVTAAGPRLHKRFSDALRIGYVILAIPPVMLLGIVLSFASQPIYTYYLAVPRIGGLSVMEDQMLGGVIMWVPGSMMYIISALLATAVWLRGEERKPPLPVSTWATKEKMAAPGLSESN
jgi:cytochrome c oxidase assembly factor CtaG